MTKKCEHINFEANVSVGRLSMVEGGPITHYTADIRIRCSECGVHLEFVGMPVGSSAYRPCASAMNDEARLPMVIPGTAVPEGLPSYIMPAREKGSIN